MAFPLSVTEMLRHLPCLRPCQALLLTAVAAIPLAGCVAGGSIADGSADPVVYEYMTDADVALAVAALQRALEERPAGDRVGWRNDASGNAGAIEPVNAYVTTGGYACRDYVERLQVDGRQARIRNTACRDDAGSWVWVG